MTAAAALGHHVLHTDHEYLFNVITLKLITPALELRTSIFGVNKDKDVFVLN